MKFPFNCNTTNFPIYIFPYIALHDTLLIHMLSPEWNANIYLSANECTWIIQYSISSSHKGPGHRTRWREQQHIIALFHLTADSHRCCCWRLCSCQQARCDVMLQSWNVVICFSSCRFVLMIVAPFLTASPHSVPYTHIVMPYVQHSQGWSEWKLTHVVCAGNSGYIVTSFRTLLFYNEIKIAHILLYACIRVAVQRWENMDQQRKYIIFLSSISFSYLSHIRLAALSEIAWKLPSFPAEFLVHMAGVVHTLDKQLEARWTGERVREKREINSLQPTTSSAWHQFILHSKFFNI